MEMYQDDDSSNVYFQCCFLWFLCDLYHSLGCFFAVEDGLFCHPAEGPNAEKIRIRNRFIFPHLWNISDQSVATTLTRLNPDLCLPAANALGQWPQDSGKKVYPPSLEVLIATKESTLEKIDELIGYLYIICVSEFLKDAKLRPLLYTCTASLIMHYQEMQTKCGSTNSVGQKLGRSLCHANIVSTAAQANTKLNEWSQLIKEDYDQKNSVVQDCNDTTILQVVQAQSVMINNLAKSHFDLKAENRRLNNTVESLEITVKNQSKIIAYLIAAAFMNLLDQRGLTSTMTMV